MLKLKLHGKDNATDPDLFRDMDQLQESGMFVRDSFIGGMKRSTIAHGYQGANMMSSGVFISGGE